MPGEPHRPKEYLASVDVALRALLVLRGAASVTVTSMAKELGVGASTAHRTLQMLKYRGFAVQTENRRYLPGPALFPSRTKVGAGQTLVNACRPHMQQIAAATGETCHLMTQQGAHCHFLFSVDGTKPVRVGDRHGHVIPAEQNSGGLALLAELSAKDLRRLYPQMGEREFLIMRRRLHKFRTQGFAVNPGLYEPDVSAIGMVLLNDVGDALGALSVAIPTARFTEVRDECIRILKIQGRDLNRTLEKLSISQVSDSGVE